jgi:hypothetical protein
MNKKTLPKSGEPPLVLQSVHHLDNPTNQNWADDRLIERYLHSFQRLLVLLYSYSSNSSYPCSQIALK